MTINTHRFAVHESRRSSHPVFTEIQKYWFTVPAAKFPRGISFSANARDPVGLNRRVYRDVRESLEGKTFVPGTFDLLNKGITILAENVRLVDKESKIFEVDVDVENGGIVDGAHTAKLIEACQEDGALGEGQHVEVYIRTGISDDIVSDIARGLNTAMKVQAMSIYNIDNVFDWLKELIHGELYSDRFAWKESDRAEYDVRDLVSILELFNIFDWPNEKSKHPISAYEKSSIVLDRFADDFKKHKRNIEDSIYYRLRPILKDALCLYDLIRRDFRTVHNAGGGAAGRMNIMEEASQRRVTFDFPFGDLAPSRYRLTKGAAYPILNCFRNYVMLDENGNACWQNSFDFVKSELREVFPELVTETFQATREISRMPNQLGKSRPHWDNLHMKVQLRLLRAQVREQRS